MHGYLSPTREYEKKLNIFLLIKWPIFFLWYKFEYLGVRIKRNVHQRGLTGNRVMLSEVGPMCSLVHYYQHWNTKIIPSKLVCYQITKIFVMLSQIYLLTQYGNISEVKMFALNIADDGWKQDTRNKRATMDVIEEIIQQCGNNYIFKLLRGYH